MLWRISGCFFYVYTKIIHSLSGCFYEHTTEQIEIVNDYPTVLGNTFPSEPRSFISEYRSGRREAHQLAAPRSIRAPLAGPSIYNKFFPANIGK